MILNTSIWQAVINEAKAKAVNPPAWLRAIDRAVVEIEKARYWSFTDGVLTIESTTSRKLYKVDAAHTCEARNGICKHRAARRLMELYFTALQAQPVALAPVAPSAMAMREAERNAAVLVRRYEGKRTYYGAIEI
ncbi:MAG: hypothetical protein HOP19_07545 [Acidobacteria bacterium]|nr:hypothetical protein [Acidobacteriota bacterium]